MKITKDETFVHGERGLSIKLMQWDTADYCFNIKAFGRDFSWLIYKGNPTPVEILEWESFYQQDVREEQ